LIFEDSLNNEKLEIYSNDSLIFSNVIIRDASTGICSFQINNENPTISIKMNNKVILRTTIPENKRALIIKGYYSWLRYVSYDITNQIGPYD
jgi:hypothetical protein